LKKEIIIPTIAITLFATLAAVLLGFTFSVTEGPIAERRAQAAAAALEALLPGSYRVEYTNINISGNSLTRIDTSFDEDGNLIGHALSAMTSGYGGAINMMVAFNPQGYIQGLQVLSHSETPGIGAIIAEDWFSDAFVGRIGILVSARRATSPQEIDAASGATISTNAILRAVNDATTYLGFASAGAPLSPAVPPTYPAIADLIPGTRFTEFNHVNSFALDWMVGAFDETGNLLGYVFFTSGRGWHGPIEMALVTDIHGTIQDLRVIHHTEAWSFGARFIDAPNFNQQFVGLNFDERVEHINVDTVSFATVSTDSILRAINDAAHYFNRNHRAPITYVQGQIYAILDDDEEESDEEN